MVYMTAILGACFFLGILYIFEVIAPRAAAENKIQILKEFQKTIQILKVSELSSKEKREFLRKLSGFVNQDSSAKSRSKGRHKQVGTSKNGKSAPEIENTTK